MRAGNILDLSPSTDHTADLLLSDSEAALSRVLFTELRKRGYDSGASVRIVHKHNGYDYRGPIEMRFTRFMRLTRFTR